MRLTADLHTHTQMSHGSGSVDENVEAAIALGLETIGIADHSINHVLYGIGRRHVQQYRETIDAAKRKFADRIEVKTGIELNIIGLDGSVDMPRGAPFDIVIAGYHKAAMCRDCVTAWRFSLGERLARDGRTQITNAYLRVLQRGDIDILAHPGYGVPIDYYKVAQACADYGTLFEINEKHSDLTEQDLESVLETKAQFVISSDAHSPDKVGRAPAAIALAQRAGVPPGRIQNVKEGTV